MRLVLVRCRGEKRRVCQDIKNLRSRSALGRWTDGEANRSTLCVLILKDEDKNIVPMASKSSAMVLSNHGGYIRGKSIPALPTNPATNPPGQFQIAVSAGDILPHYSQRAPKMPILGYCSATSCSSIMVSFRAMKLGSNAHNEHIYGCARAIFQWRCDCNATDDATHFFFTLQNCREKYASPINNI